MARPKISEWIELEMYSVFLLRILKSFCQSRFLFFANVVSQDDI